MGKGGWAGCCKREGREVKGSVGGHLTCNCATRCAPTELNTRAPARRHSHAHTLTPQSGARTEGGERRLARGGVLRDKAEEGDHREAAVLELLELELVQVAL